MNAIMSFDQHCPIYWLASSIMFKRNTRKGLLKKPSTHQRVSCLLSNVNHGPVNSGNHSLKQTELWWFQMDLWVLEVQEGSTTECHKSKLWTQQVICNTSEMKSTQFRFVFIWSKFPRALAKASTGAVCNHPSQICVFQFPPNFQFSVPASNTVWQMH